jgi:hypothetical protein
VASGDLAPGIEKIFRDPSQQDGTLQLHRHQLDAITQHDHAQEDEHSASGKPQDQGGPISHDRVPSPEPTNNNDSAPHQFPALHAKY